MSPRHERRPTAPPHAAVSVDHRSARERERLHQLVAALPDVDLVTAARVLAALGATRAGGPGPSDAGELAGAVIRHGVCLLSVDEVCRRLAGISRDTFDRDRELRALVQPATRGRVGVREDALEALILRRGTPTDQPQAVPPPAGARPYRRRHRRPTSAT